MQRDVNYDGQVMLSIWNQFVRLALSVEHFCEQKSHRTIDNKIGKHSEERTKILNLIKKTTNEHQSRQGFNYFNG